MERNQDKSLKKMRAKHWILAALLVVLLSGCSAAREKGESTASAPGAASSALTEQKSDMLAAQPAGDAAAPAMMDTNSAAKEKASTAKPADSFNGNALGDIAVERKIIYKANITMQVDKYEEAQAKIESAVSQAGGYILQFNENENNYEKSGMFIIKVPANGFQSLMKQLETINPSAKKNMQGQDVSEEFVDLTSRLKAKQVVESRLIAFMEKASKTDELLAFSNELGKVQEEIERIKGRMRYLEQNVSYSTIEVRLAQKLGSAAVIQANDRGPLFQRMASALNESAVVLTVVFEWLIVAAAAVLPVALVLFLILLPIVVVRRSRKKKMMEIRKKLTEENGEVQPDLSQDSTVEDKS
ncbi:DUF4349 domain-containing protein [Paenibacillus sp. FSL H7-0331]|uniref:DUF4349 domain-containing protein n=1 Tax=Paenibacillus sp. FSL H7-0331 TaxID=1920421 RepID=UPI00096C6D80|nr:DUF4349 domain-containing protein [Paenibacillus sp. FSL H7-0331]OMF20591.1 hypothetical protein BK127_00630 [Paenibacillus sp. FSL H7-0331]